LRGARAEEVVRHFRVGWKKASMKWNTFSVVPAAQKKDLR
jgi:hypothetical protein